MRFAATDLNSFMDPMNFGAIGKASIMGRGLVDRAGLKGDAYVDAAEIKGNETIGVAEAGVSATAAEASAASQGAIWDGISSGISGLAGGISKMPGAGGGGPAPFADTTGLNKGLGVGYGQLSDPSYLQLSQKVSPSFKW
tara:strand:+ start:6372 stop:6791 length:420 start_codon:yes stop_codon:yes gene_type:complete